MQDDTSESTAMLTPVEARIIGSLFEKQATTPETYPLTLNAVVVACNQKTAREPVMQLEPGAVGHALRQLESAGWVKSHFAARADRYEHRLEARLNVTRQQGALIALLLLRGPQTLNEVYSRSERLAKFDSEEAVQHALERLAQREPALVRELPRQSGQREARFAHLLSGEPVLPALSESAPRGSGGSSALEQRLDALEARVAVLEAQLAGRAETGN